MEEVIAVDIETFDPGLKKRLGPGSIRGDGHIISVAVHAPHLNVSKVFHPEEPALKDILATGYPKVFHNAVYDLDWLVNGAGFIVNGRIEDTMTRAVLLSIYEAHYDLDTCCKRAGITGKNKEDTIEAWWASQGKKGHAIEHLNEVPFNTVAKYNLQDSIATWELYQWQAPRLTEQGLDYANGIECSLYPWLMQCRKNGIRMDWKKRDEVSRELHERLDALRDKAYAEYGTFNVNASRSLAQAFARAGIPVKTTDKGNPSFTKDVLKDIQHPLAEAVLEIRALDKLLGTFVDGQFLEFAYNGRIYSCLYPMKRDGNGTITGRFSSATINMQNVPARSADTGSLIRGLFIPDEGCYIGAFDYSQIEYRVFAHFAEGEGASEIRAKYAENPLLDFHGENQKLMHWTDPDPHKNKELRGLTKNLGFGILYGLGKKSFATHFKKDILRANPHFTEDMLPEYVAGVFADFAKRLPYMQGTAKLIEDTCRNRGYIRTISGRRIPPPPKEKVFNPLTKRWGEQSPIFKVTNFLCQGSAADIVKRAIADSVKAGVWSELKGYTMVHDELVFGIPQTKVGAEAAIELHQCMKNAYAEKLRVPLHVDTEIGTDWGNCDEETWNNFLREVGL